MTKRTIIGLAASGVLLLGIIGSASTSQTQNASIIKNKSGTPSASAKVQTAPTTPKATPLIFTIRQ
jgi:hypothetical protein